MQTAELEAGVELDALIAEKVMGWCRLTYFERYGPAHHDTAYGRATRTPHWHSVDGQEQALSELSDDDVWSPSSDIADAWQVVERMRAQGWFCQVTGHNGESLGPWWEAQFSRDPGPNQKFQEFTSDHLSTAPLAICRAALAAIGH